jgi:D-3-phosphoglycerate dehydrogenase
MAPRVLISDSLSDAAVAVFRDRGIEADFQPKLGPDKDRLAEIIGNYDGLAIRSATKVTPKVIAAANGRLRVIGRAGIGVDNVDIPAATAQGIIVMNTAVRNSITTAEHAIAMLMACAPPDPLPRPVHSGRQLGERAASWGRDHRKGAGVIGCGNIGSIVAQRAQGLAMRVIAFDPFLSEDRAMELGVGEGRTRPLFARSDFITLHTP